MRPFDELEHLIRIFVAVCGKTEELRRLPALRCVLQPARRLRPRRLSRQQLDSSSAETAVGRCSSQTGKTCPQSDSARSTDSKADVKSRRANRAREKLLRIVPGLDRCILRAPRCPNLLDNLYAARTLPPLRKLKRNRTKPSRGDCNDSHRNGPCGFTLLRHSCVNTSNKRRG